MAVNEILNGMDEEQKKWIEAWIDKDLIEIPLWQKS
jgi:hypothetical protein